MFHLDDYSIVAILSFTDPFSLTSFEATSRHSRRLVKLAWNVHDKILTKSQREGGTTPRQRVLSSFALHKSSVMSRLSQLIEDSSCSDLSERGIHVLPWEELDESKHLVFLRMSGLTSHRHSPFQTYCETTIGIKANQIARRGSIRLARVPLTKDQFGLPGGAGIVGNDMAGLLDSLYTAKGAAENTSFHPESIVQSCKRIDSLNRRLDTISIVAFNRQTLAPSILFKEDDRSGGATRTILACTREYGHLSIFADVDRSMNVSLEAGVADASLVTRSVCFYFQRDSFCLALAQSIGSGIVATH